MGQLNSALFGSDGDPSGLRYKGLGGELTREHWMGCITDQEQSLAVPGWNGLAVEELPELDIRRFSAGGLGLI